MNRCERRHLPRLVAQSGIAAVGTGLLSAAWAFVSNIFATDPSGPNGDGRPVWGLVLCWVSTVALLVLLRRAPRTTFVAALVAASLVAVVTSSIYGTLTAIVLLGAEDARNALQLIVSLGAGGVGPLVIVVGLLLVRARTRRVGVAVALVLSSTPLWFALLRFLDVRDCD